MPLEKNLRFNKRPVVTSTIKHVTKTIISNRYFNNCLNVGSPNLLYNDFLSAFCENIITIDLEPQHEKVIQMNALDLNMKDNTFDLVFSNQVIEHIPQNKQFLFLKESLRVCKPGGIVIAITPNQFAPTRFLELSYKIYLDEDHKKEFNWFYSKSILKSLRKEFGCKVRLMGTSYSDAGEGNPGYHPRPELLWGLLPMCLSHVLEFFPLFCRGHVLVLEKA